MAMTQREYRGLMALAGLMLAVVAVCAVADCSRRQPAAMGSIWSETIQTEAIKTDAVAIAADSASAETESVSRRKRTKKQPGRKMKSIQPDRESPLENVL